MKVLSILVFVVMTMAMAMATAAVEIDSSELNSNVPYYDKTIRELKKSESRSKKSKSSKNKGNRKKSSEEEEDEDENIMNVTATATRDRSSSSKKSKKSRRRHRRQAQLDIRYQLSMDFQNSTCPETNPCSCVWAGFGGVEGDYDDDDGSSDEDFYRRVNEQRLCHHYNELPLIKPTCDGKEEIVPRIYHSVNGAGDFSNGTSTTRPHHHQFATSLSNPSYERNHHTDESAYEYIKNMCWQEVADAYKCMTAPAYRGDIFRFCALWAEGGVYLDEDIVPIVPLEDLYSPCSVATVGHDFPLGGVAAKQMKILAGAPGAAIFECALETIVEHVRFRVTDLHVLEFTGPQMLHKCYKKHSEHVAISYIDAKHAVWPYTGMRAGKNVLAYELPRIKRDMEGKSSDPTDYNLYFKNKNLYDPSCPL